MIASTKVTVFPVPGGPKTTYGAEPDSFDTIAWTAVRCSGFPSTKGLKNFRLGRLRKVLRLEDLGKRTLVTMPRVEARERARCFNLAGCRFKENLMSHQSLHPPKSLLRFVFGKVGVDSDFTQNF